MRFEFLPPPLRFIGYRVTTWGAEYYGFWWFCLTNDRKFT